MLQGPGTDEGGHTGLALEKSGAGEKQQVHTQTQRQEWWPGQEEQNAREKLSAKPSPVFFSPCEKNQNITQKYAGPHSHLAHNQEPWIF